MKTKQQYIFSNSDFQHATLQRLQYCTAMIFCGDSKLLMLLSFGWMNVCTTISQRWSQHVGYGTLAVHSSSSKGCMDTLRIGNDRFYMVLQKSLAAVVSRHWIIVFFSHLCNGFWRKISCYNRISYKCEFKKWSILSLYYPWYASSNSGKSETILGLYKVYDVYLVETERDGCSYVFHGYIIIYFQIGKVARRFQCNF